MGDRSCAGICPPRLRWARKRSGETVAEGCITGGERGALVHCTLGARSKTHSPILATDKENRRAFSRRRLASGKINK